MDERGFLPDKPGEGEYGHTPIVYVREEQTWEYKIITLDLTNEQALGEGELNKLGAEGWEMCGVLLNDQRLHYYFKRTK